MTTVELTDSLFSMIQHSHICGSQVSNESNVNPKTRAVLVSGIIESFKNKGGCGED